MSCPSFDNFSVAENILNDWVMSQNTTDPTFAQSYCFYGPQIWETGTVFIIVKIQNLS